jgi:phosphate:Na+ symporter
MDAVREIVNMAVDAFENDDVNLASEVEPLEDVIDMIHSAVKGRHVQRLQEGTCTIEQGFILNDLGTNLERVADHCSNLAVCVVEQARGEFNMHNYLSDVKKYDTDGFEDKMAKYQAKYTLPA